MNFEIDVTRIEEFQMTSNLMELDKIFQKAYITITGGGKIILYRRLSTGIKQPFEELASEDALIDYKTKVYKYLPSSH